MSPETQNTGSLQGMCITTSCLHLQDRGVIPKFDTIRPIICKGVDRRSVLDSDALQALVDAMSEIAANDSVYVVATSMTRIGVKYEDITRVMKHLVGARNNVEILFLDSYGIDHDIHARYMSTYYSSLDVLCCNHNDAGKAIKIPKKVERERERYFSNAKVLKDQWQIAGIIPQNLQDAVIRGKELPMKIITVRMWIKYVILEMKDKPQISAKKLVALYPYKTDCYVQQRHQEGGVIDHQRQKKE